MRTPICDRLGIEFPLFAFSHCRDVVAAVSKAGGYGVLGALAFSPDQLEIELSWIDEHIGGKPYGVDFAMPEKFVGKGDGSFSIEYLQSLIPAEHRDTPPVQALLDTLTSPAFRAEIDALPGYDTSQTGHVVLEALV